MTTHHNCLLMWPLILVPALLLVLGLRSTAAAEQAGLSVIPRPASVEMREGTFTLRPQTGILIEPECPELTGIGQWLADFLRRATGYRLTLAAATDRDATGPVILLRLARAETALGEEGYRLTASADGVTISARRPAGVFYGVQTLRQLFTAEIESPRPVADVEWTVPCVQIEDRPRFRWRGMHLDVARHFFDKEFVKRYIDYIAAYKINVFHLYLTDDQGWRIEIKRFPRLTEVGAWRKGTRKHYSDGRGDQERYGGYFTQDDVREIVAYARARFITVVPGISMPGHSRAALAAYPELSSTGGPFEVWTQWGITKEVMDPGKEEVFRFVEGVLGEVTDLFPGRYIHCGGDEVPRDRWKGSSYAQARMKAEGLKNEDELQSYFTKRVERFLNSKGRVLVGWDEIIAGGLAPNAVVMSWRGTAGGIAAARAGHDVVMVPNRETYFNYMQHTERKGPGHTGYLPLMNVYHFEPTRGMAPEEAGHVLGSQACLWTEYVPTPADVEYLLFPRLFAMAEVVWSPPGLREDEDFLRRVPVGLARLKQAGVNYYDGNEYRPK